MWWALPIRGVVQTYLTSDGRFRFGTDIGHVLEWTPANGRLSGRTSLGGGLFVDQWYADVNEGGKLFAGGGDDGITQVALTVEGCGLTAVGLAEWRLEKEAIDPSKLCWFPDIHLELSAALPRAEVWGYERLSMLRWT